MKILVLPSWYPPVGGSFFKEQSEAVLGAGCKVDVLVNEIRSIRRFAPLRGKKNFQVRHVNEDGLQTTRAVYWKIPKFERLNALRWANKTLALFDEYYQKNGAPDLIHVHSAIWGGYAAALIKEKHKIPYIITENRGRFGAITQMARDHLKEWYAPLLHQALSMCDLLIPVSKILIPKMQSYVPEKELNIKVIPNMVRTDDFFPPETRRPPKPFIFLLVAGLTPVKGVDLLLPAFEKLLKKYPQSILRIGGDGDSKPALEKQARHLGIQGNVEFLGRLGRQQVNQAMQNAHAFVLASRIEAMPHVVIEAFATGLPVMATRVVSDEVVLPHTGFLTEVEDIEAMRQGMEKLIENYHRFEPEKIRAHAVENFSQQAFVKRIMAVYNQIAKKTP